jgi:hypothetical protein
MRCEAVCEGWSQDKCVITIATKVNSRASETTVKYAYSLEGFLLDLHAVYMEPNNYCYLRCDMCAGCAQLAFVRASKLALSAAGACSRWPLLLLHDIRILSKIVLFIDQKLPSHRVWFVCSSLPVQVPLTSQR